MVTLRNLISAVTVSASMFLMPVTCLLDSFPVLTSPALASFPQQTESTFSYRPPNRGMPRQTQGTGSRGCNSSQPVALALLVPKDHTAQTASGHPVFFWHISEVPAEPIEFALVESGVAQPIWVQQLQLKKAGIVRLEMPKHLPELAQGRDYRWSVTLICNANRRSNDTFAQGWIKRVSEPPSLKQQLATATSDRDRASIYAQAGFWYDALQSLSTAQAVNASDLSLREDFLLLLDEAGLTEVALKERQRLR